MKYAYPAVFHPEDGAFVVTFPDIQMGATEGDTVAEAILNAEDFLALALYDFEIDKKPLPQVSKVEDIQLEDGDFITMIAVDTDTYYRKAADKLVKKTLGIPSWMNERAEAANINFSKTLQEALKQKLDTVE